MKSLFKYVIVFFGICFLDACKENSPEGDKPAPIVEYTVTPIHGGATISYTIPRDPNILYVMAEYTRNGEPFTERSSKYTNSLTIEGFNTTNPVNATLYTVSRDHEIKSDPVTIQFTPLESPLVVTVNSIEIVPGFGGIVATWENVTQTELGVRLMVDSMGTMIEKELYFTSLASEKHSFRGFENVETSFVLSFEDKWGNISEPVRFKGTPLFETEVDKPWVDLRRMIPYDNITEEGAAYAFSKVWDKALTNSNSYLNVSGSSGNSMTFDLGVKTKLSRMIFWMTQYNGYTADVVWGTCNITEFEMWGTTELDYDKLSDLPYWLHPFSAAETSQPLPDHTFMDDWVYLGRYSIPRLDFLGVSIADQQQAVSAGFEFEIPLECAPVRIIRFYPLTTANGGSPPARNNWWIAEMSFFGDTTIPQD